MFSSKMAKRLSPYIEGKLEPGCFCCWVVTHPPDSIFYYLRASTVIGLRILGGHAYK